MSHLIQKMLKDTGKPLLITLFAVVVILTGCDNSLDPVRDDTGAFTVHGLLDINEPVNPIRVRSLSAPFTPEATEEIDATVTLTNLVSGETETLASERIEFDGTFAHNFMVTRPVEPDTDYLLRVTRSDGEQLELQTRTPSYINPILTPDLPDCYTEVSIELEPFNGGVMLLQVGFEITRVYWPFQTLIRPENYDESGRVELTFRPVDLIQLVGQNPPSDFRCNNLTNPNFFIRQLHFSPGLYEQIRRDSLAVTESITRFGGIYLDLYEYPVDRSVVCPPDC